MLDIPPKAKEGGDTTILQFAYRTRVKLFMRPANLPGKPEEAPTQLSWKTVPAANGKGLALSVSNPTPYYVSFSAIEVESGGKTYQNEAGGMVAPKATEVLPVTQMNAVQAGAKVHYTAISDYGAALKGDAPLGQ